MTVRGGADATPPVITLTGPGRVSVTEGSDYADAGATCLDDVDGAVPVAADGDVDVKTVGSYNVTYSCSDSAGNRAPQVVRTVDVVNAPPALQLVGPGAVTVNIGSAYVDQGAVCSDQADGDIPPTVDSRVDTSAMGTYEVAYSCTDSGGASATPVVRTVTVYGMDPARPLDAQIASGEITIPTLPYPAVVALGPDQATLAWAHVDGSTHYTILANGGGSVASYTTGHNVQTVAGLRPDTLYQLFVVDSHNDLVGGAPFSVRTPGADSDLRFTVSVMRVAPVPGG